MKIEYAIVSSNNNRTYLDFWPIVNNLWSNLIGIKPILVLISDKNLVTDYGTHIIHELKEVKGVDTGLQSQISRMYITKYYQDSVCITSDIDMLPLSHNYFNNVVNDIDENHMVILSSDAYENKFRFPICYNVAKGSLFNEILDLNVDFPEYIDRLLKYNWGWDTDELYFGLKINEFKDKEKIHLFNRGWSNGIANKRIDRVVWRYDVNVLKKDNYIDCHSLRPYETYKNVIDELIINRFKTK
jgi:hypothetical protein